MCLNICVYVDFESRLFSAALFSKHTKHHRFWCYLFIKNQNINEQRKKMKPNSSIFVSVMNATRFSPSSHSHSPLTPVSEWITQINRSMLVSYFNLITQFTSLFAMFQSISFIPIDERIALRRIYYFFESNSWLVSYCLRYLSSIMLFMLDDHSVEIKGHGATIHGFLFRKELWTFFFFL